MGSREKTHFKRTPTLKMKWTIPISGALVSLVGAQNDQSTTEFKLINSDKQIRIGDKCATAIDGLGGLLSIADCDTTSTYQQFMSYGVSQIRTFHVDCCLAAREEDRYTEGLHPGWFVRVEECDRMGGSPNQWFAVRQSDGKVESFSDPTKNLCWQLDNTDDREKVALVECDSLDASAEETWLFSFEQLPFDTEDQRAQNNNPCGAYGFCEDGQRECTCHCRVGYHGVHCDEISLCLNNPGYDPNDPNSIPDMTGDCASVDTAATCSGDQHSRTCHCSGDSGKKGETCTEDRTACDHEEACLNGGICSTGASLTNNGVVLYSYDLVPGGTHECDCTGTGFEGPSCSLNVDDCTVDSCNGHGQCIDGINDFTCQCDPGWFLEFCTQEGLYQLDEHMFTSCNTIGRYGPRIGECAAAYGTEFSSIIEAEHFEISETRPGVQVLTVAKTGSYYIIAKGGDGGANEAAGRGALVMTPQAIQLTAGEKLYVIVGQAGSESNWHDAVLPSANKRAGGGGGGGSFVWTDDKLYVVAGGGGGQSYYASGGHGSSTKMSTYCMTLEEVQNTVELHSGQVIGRCLTDDCYSLQSPNLGEGGRAGLRSSKTQPTAGGGGGWYSDGQDGLESTNNWPGGDGGISAGSVATGGKFSSHTLRQSYEEDGGGNGGFGGGGSLAGVTGQGGGGGGYTGGNGGHSGNQAARGACPSGGGGGSYVDNFESNYYLFDDNAESLRTDLPSYFTPERQAKIQQQLDEQAQLSDVRMQGNGFVYLEYVSTTR